MSQRDFKEMDRHMREMVKLFVGDDDVALLKEHGPFLMEAISRVIDEHFDEFRETMGLDEQAARDVLNRLKDMPRAMDLEDLGPITQLALISVRNEISFYAGAIVLIKIIQYLRPFIRERFSPEETERIIGALEKFGMIFVILLSDEMHKAFFDAVEKATGMSRTLFRNYVRAAINTLIKEYAGAKD